MTEAFRIRWGMWNASVVAAASVLAIVALVGAQFQVNSIARSGAASTSAHGSVSHSLAALAERHPQRQVEVIVRFKQGTTAAEARHVVAAAGGRVTRDLHIINGLGVRLRAAAAERLSGQTSVDLVSLNAAVKPSSVDMSRLATAYPHSIRAPKVWNKPGAGKASQGEGIGIAVIDTGIQGDLPDFRVSDSDQRSRVIASAVVNPGATSAGDTFGHGTHVAALIAGDGTSRAASHALYGKYIGVAPAANLISVKVADDQGEASVLDVIDGLQFVVDHKNDFNIRIVNLSLSSETAQSYKTDPLDAAAEQAWNAGIVVVASAGNRGKAADAVDYAPGNDPFVITVGASDDRGTKETTDDLAATWSSTGVTQDGYAKPEFLAPGARMVSALSPGSEIESLCPSCAVDGEYFRMGGTSMSTAVVSGTVALALSENPQWSPNQVKSALENNLRSVPGIGSELDAYSTYVANRAELRDPNTYALNTYIDPSTGQIDYSRSSWSRSRWSTASGDLSAGWARSSWSCTSCLASSDEVDPSRSSWSRSRWSRSRWSMSFTK